MRKYFFVFVILLKITLSEAQVGIVYSISKTISTNMEKKKVRSYAQKYSLSEFIYNDTIELLRVPENIISSDAKEYIIKVQTKLENSHKQYLDNELCNNWNISHYISLIKSYDIEWPITLYTLELNKYEEYNKTIQHKRIELKQNSDSIERLKQQIEKRKQDSIQLAINIENEKILMQKRKADFKADSLYLINNPYRMLELNLCSFSYNKYFTVFIGLDYYFSYNRLSSFLQLNMNLTPTKSSETPTLFIQRFVPTVSTGHEFLLVACKVKKTNNKPYFPTDGGKCNMITECKITGSSDLILNLFLLYWPQRLKIGSYKQGEIAHYDYMGDRVSLIGVSPPNTYKILIEKGNATIDYYESFKIK